VELVLEANEGYWRKTPTIKRIIFKGVPERPTRLAMLKTGEADIAYLMIGDEAVAVKADPELRLAQVIPPAVWYLEFTEQWDAKSPWHDQRVRLAANLAIDKQAINETERLGLSRLTGSIIPRQFDFALPLEPHPYDPARAKQLLAEAGYPNGFDAGDLNPAPPFFTKGEAIANYLAAVGIRTKIITMERAAFQAAWLSKKLKGLCFCVHAPYGNAATRMAQFVPSTGDFARGADPDVDNLFKQQVRETDRKKREAMLHQIQQLLHERVRFGAIWEYIWPIGIGPRVAEPALLKIDPYPWSAPYEDVALKKR
jgi:peptide/nickel transport system substrate-binding protein